jgi:hypothetical protein
MISKLWMTTFVVYTAAALPVLVWALASLAA